MAGTAPISSSGSTPQARIVLDASGGDSLLGERVSGAADAAELYEDIEVILCGDREQILREFDVLGRQPGNTRVVDAPMPIGMHEPPVQALRQKPRSSIVVGIQMVANGEADAFVSAGNTGAVTAASTLKLGRLKGVQRPGIAAAMRVIDHPVVAIDVGANVDSKPLHLLQYAIMATVFAREVLEMEDPRVGLLNVGEEALKGNDLSRQAFDLISKSYLNFVGNVEPGKLFSGGCDILICDGFVGNVLLKVGESLILKLIEWLREQVQQNLRYKLGFLMCKDLFAHLKHCGDHSEYGGAPLLGLNGVTIIAHGASDARAIRNAIREARSFVEMKVNEHIEEAIQKDVASRRNARPAP